MQKQTLQNNCTSIEQHHLSDKQQQQKQNNNNKNNFRTETNDD